ncbi:MAG: Asp-tRNA(Asn)/Glu-tRNA(Gln) amidotransferase subunit GatC [Planctomycetota bacterium]
MPDTVDAAQVRHVSLLSRITLSDEEIRMFGRQLSSIVSYFDKLNELDTADVEPMAHALDFHNVLAADALGESLTPEQALANAPARDDDFFMVPKVIGDS